MEKIIKVSLTIFVIVICIITIYLGINSNTKNNENNKLDSPTTVEPSKEFEPDNKETKILFAEYYDKAKKIMDTMSIEEKVGQMFIIPYSTVNVRDFSNVGGFIYYGNNVSFSTKYEIKKMISNTQSKAKIKYATVIDEEGGTVSRLGTNPHLRESIFPSPRNLYKKGGLDLILETEDEKDALLLELGFNLNLAPVADISNARGSFIYDRSIGLDADKTAEYISAVTKKAKENGLSTCLKHFPGYGNNIDDTHYESLKDKRSLESFQENDFIPFKAGIEAETPFILMSHNTITAIDSLYPASISKSVIDILKNDLNYTGLILTDDIAMNALAEYNFNGEAATLAVQAGNDMIMTGKINTHYNEILNAIKENIITEERINESVIKILSWKLAYNII